jgi:hypothetical protein
MSSNGVVPTAASVPTIDADTTKTRETNAPEETHVSRSGTSKVPDAIGEDATVAAAMEFDIGCPSPSNCSQLVACEDDPFGSKSGTLPHAPAFPAATRSKAAAPIGLAALLAVVDGYQPKRSNSRS